MKNILVFLLLFLTVGLSAQQADTRSQTKVVIGGIYYYIHTVTPKETLSSLSRVYDCPAVEIRRNNPHIGEQLKISEVVKIPVVMPVRSARDNKKSEIHVVNIGETAYAIAKRYGVSAEELIKANPGFDPSHISVGQSIQIPHNAKGRSGQDAVRESFNSYKEGLNLISERFENHLVEPKETLLSLSRKYNVSVDTIRKYNEKELFDGLKIGAIIKVPVATKEVVILEQPRERAMPKAINSSKPLNVVMVMPFASSGQSFVEFYNGVLIALNELRAEGISINLNVLDSKRSVTQIEKLIEDRAFANADLIIGPVYNEEFVPLADYATKRGIVIVSPLTAVSAGGDFVFQITPDADSKYSKIRDMLHAEGQNIVMITSADADRNLKAELERELPSNIKHITYSKQGTSAQTFDGALSFDKQNIIVIPTENENTVEEILARISSLQNSILARTGRQYSIKTIGTPRWARFQLIDKQLFFKLGVMYVTNYYADRSNKAVQNFDREYITAFGAIPSLFSYRGYDVMKLFVWSLNRYGEDFIKNVNRITPELLQIDYTFRKDVADKWQNSEWAVVKYADNYIIEVK